MPKVQLAQEKRDYSGREGGERLVSALVVAAIAPKMRQ